MSDLKIQAATVKTDADLINAVMQGAQGTLTQDEMKRAFDLLSSRMGVKVRISTAKAYEARTFDELIDYLNGGKCPEGYKVRAPENQEQYQDLKVQLQDLVVNLAGLLEPGVKLCIEFDSRGFGQARLKELWKTEKTGDKVKKVQVDNFDLVDEKPTVQLF